eukprot:gene2490-2833_t
MEVERFIKKYKGHFVVGFFQGIAYGIGLGVASVLWHKYLRTIVFNYFQIPLMQSAAVQGIKTVSYA